MFGEMTHPCEWDKPIPGKQIPNDVVEDKRRTMQRGCTYCAFNKVEKNTLREGQGNSFFVSKICNIHNSASLIVDRKSWTLRCDSLFPEWALSWFKQYLFSDLHVAKYKK